MTRKLIIHDGRSERELVLIGTITVGRDPGCHINDLDPLLSRRHAEFVTNAAGCTVRDLGSRNGMLVNGEKIREHRLVPGDLVQFGHLQLRYEEEHAVAAPEVLNRAHATTAHESATVAIAAPPATLDDTQPHPHHAHAGHQDDDATRAPAAGKPDDAPTRATRGGAKNDGDDTMAVGKRPATAGLDATMAAGTVTGFDATFVPGSHQDLDATVVAGAGPSVDLDATFAPSTVGAQTASPAARPVEARLSAGSDLRITAATPGCRDVFGVGPESLVGRPLGDVLVERLKAASANGSSELTLVVDRTGSDRSLSLLVKAAQAVEAVS